MVAIKRFITLCLTLFLTFSIYSQDSIQELLPIEVLLKKSDRYSYSISPNGKFFVQVVKDFFNSDIIVVDVEKYKVFKTIPVKNKVVSQVHWTSNNRLLYEASGEIFAIDKDGSNYKLIVNNLADKLIKSHYRFYRNFRFNNLVDILPKNKYEVLVEVYDYSLYSTIQKVNIFTGEKETIISGKKDKINKWVCDKKGVPRFGIRFEEDKIKYLHLNKNNEWEQFYVHIGTQKFPLAIEARSHINQPLSFEGFSDNPNIIYITSNINSDKRKLYTYNLSKQEVLKVVAKDAICDIYDPHGEGFSLIEDHKNSTLAGVRYEAVIPQFKWYSEDFKSTHSILNNKFPNKIHEILQANNNNDSFLINQWSDTNAGNIGVFNKKDSSYSVMFHFNEELNKFKLSKTKILIANSRDGSKIPCYLNLPSKYSKDKSTPIVVIPHGGPWARDYWEMNKFVQYFTSRGFATLRVNYRGSTGFGKSHIKDGLSSIDEIMINDIVDATKRITNKYNLNQDKVFIFGHSYGGYAAYMSLVKYPHMFSSGVAVSAPTDIKKWMKLQKKEKNYFSLEFWNMVLGNNDNKYLSKISPITYVKDFQKPLLIFHGKNDEVIPVTQAEQMEVKLKEENKQVKLEIISGEGHSIFDSNSLGYILERSSDFFKAN